MLRSDQSNPTSSHTAHGPQLNQLQKSINERIEERLLAGGQTYEIPVPIIANFLSSSFLSLLNWWLDNKMMFSPEQMDRIY